MTDGPAASESGAHGIPLVLVPGFWLGAWAWEEVLPHLADTEVRPLPVTLPGLDGAEDRSEVTLEDHVQALVDLVDEQPGPVVLVAHSGSAWPVHMTVDRRPDRVRRVVYVDTGPMVDGVAAGEPADGAADVPFPTDDELAADELSTEGLESADLARLRERAVPQPAGVVSAPMRLTDERRFTVPVTVICTSMPAHQLQDLIDSGALPSELPHLPVTYVDLPTGHWPMLSRPADLAGALLEAVRQDAPAE